MNNRPVGGRCSEAEKLTINKIFKKFHAFYGTERFIMFIRDYPEPAESTLHPPHSKYASPRHPPRSRRHYPFSALCGYLFSIFVVTLHVWLEVASSGHKLEDTPFHDGYL
jgi:hypothetical protein